MSSVRDASKAVNFTTKNSLITMGTEQNLPEVSNILHPELISNVHISANSKYNSYETLDSLMSNDTPSDYFLEQDEGKN